jgi:endonuclease YncB( thermonuclease family)
MCVLPNWIRPLTVVWTLTAASVASAGTDPDQPAPESGKVIKVYDGDTITLASGDKVRLRWVNTPELRPLEPFAEEARDSARALLMNQEVQLQYGPGSNRDGYGRLIAGIRAEQVDLSMHLVQQGFAHVFLIPPDDLDPSALLAAQDVAKEAKKGIWSLPQLQGALHITSFHANGRGDDAKYVNGEYLRVTNLQSVPIELSSYTIENRAGKVFSLPEVTLPAGHTVKIHSGMGSHRTDPSEQIAVYLGSEAPLYDNKRDHVIIRSKDGSVVTERVHRVK